MIMIHIKIIRHTCWTKIVTVVMTHQDIYLVVQGKKKYIKMDKNENVSTKIDRLKRRRRRRSTVS